MSITDVTKVTAPSRRLVERMRKIRLSEAKKSGRGELLRILREQMRRKPKTMYVDWHKPETLAISSEGNRQVTVVGQRHSCSRSVK